MKLVSLMRARTRSSPAGRITRRPSDAASMAQSGAGTGSRPELWLLRARMSPLRRITMASESVSAATVSSRRRGMSCGSRATRTTSPLSLRAAARVLTRMLSFCSCT